MSFARLVRFFGLNEPDARKSSCLPVLKRTVSRSASSWITVSKLRCGRLRFWVWVVHEPRRIAIPLRLRSRAREWLLPLCAREATRYSRLCVAVSVFTKQPRLFPAPPSRLAQKPPVLSGALRASAVGLAKLARKIVVEILFRKVFLKFYFTKFQNSQPD